MTESVLLYGDIIYNKDEKSFCVHPNSYLALEDGRVAGIFERPLDRWCNAPCHDYSGCLIIPGMYDLHLHAPQYVFRGLGGDLPLLPWLERYAFPEEMRYENADYAAARYAEFVCDLRRSFTCRAAVFATIHEQSSLYLARLLEDSGLFAYVGRVSMDRHAPQALCEGEDAALRERRWIEEMLSCGFKQVRPIITPRFAPACTPNLLRSLGELAGEYNLPVQSHLSENQAEIALVADLWPNIDCYGKVYDEYGLLGQTPTLMAHCVHCSESEQELLRKTGVWAVHCPASNIALVSGAAPVVRMMNKGINIGLGTDIAGGAQLSLFRTITDAVSVSKLRVALCDSGSVPLSFVQAFYLATVGGGAFFGGAGRFDFGAPGDALVIDDRGLSPRQITLSERLERAVYLLDNSLLQAKYIQGRKIYHI